MFLKDYVGFKIYRYMNMNFQISFHHQNVYKAMFVLNWRYKNAKDVGTCLSRLVCGLVGLHKDSYAFGSEVDVGFVFETQSFP